jgi:hypothetical protein
MKKLVLGLVLALTTSTSFATTVIASGRAIELTAHRVEKLVNLKKIDASFVSMLQTIELEKLSQTQAGDPAFIATASQVAGIDGTRNQVEIVLDDQGKALSFKVKSGSPSKDAPVWAEKNSASLIESSLHFLLDHGAEKPDVKPFFESALTLNLSKMNSNGKDFALVIITAKDTQAVLNIVLGLDGSFQSYEIK